MLNGITGTTGTTGTYKITGGTTGWIQLGQDIDGTNFGDNSAASVSLSLDGTTVIMISTLNVLGKPFYEELKKNNVSFPNDMDEFIQQRLKVLDRDKKIDSIIKDNP